MRRFARRLERIARPIAVALASVAGLLGLYWILNADTPIKQWPMWRYVSAALLATLFATSCLVAGHWLVVRILRRTLRFGEHLTVAFALGVFVFQLLVAVFGFLGLLRPVTAYLLPAILLAVGARRAIRTGLRWRRLARSFRGVGPPTPRAGVLPVVLSCVVLFGFALRTVTVAGTGFDPGWYHLPIAETYAAMGAIRAFPEGWYMGAYPHMGSILYTWGMLTVKDTTLAVAVCAKIEFFFIVAGLLATVPVVRALLGPRGRAPWAPGLIAAYPGVYLYYPEVRADFIAFAFAPPLLLVTLRMWRDFEPRVVALGSLVLATMLLVKYTSVAACFGPVLALAGRALWLLLRPAAWKIPGAQRTILKALLVGSAVVLTATSTHWLKNWVFYGNPIYPLLPKTLGGPWTQAAADYQRWFFWETEIWRPPPGWEGLRLTFRTMFTFSFEPHEWPHPNSGRPMWGSLFSLTLPALLVLRGARRVLALHLAVMVGVAVWFNIHQQDRYLLALLPWMISVTAATGLLLYRSGIVPRLCALVAGGVQVLWGTQWMLDTVPVVAAVQEVLKSRDGKDLRKKQLRYLEPWSSVGPLLPKDAKLLVHEHQLHFGTGRATVSDAQPFQGALSYVELGSDARVFDRLVAMGVTHIFASPESRGLDTLGSDLVFHSFLSRYGQATERSELRAMPRTRPPDVAPETRLVFIESCGALPEPAGLYRVIDLTRPGIGRPPPTPARAVELLGSTRDASTLERAVARAEFAVIGTNCGAEVVQSVSGFGHLTMRGGLRLLIRPTR